MNRENQKEMSVKGVVSSSRLNDGMVSSHEMSRFGLKERLHCRGSTKEWFYHTNNIIHLCKSDINMSKISEGQRSYTLGRGGFHSLNHLKISIDIYYVCKVYTHTHTYE